MKRKRILGKFIFILLSAILSGNFTFPSAFAIDPPVAVDDIAITNEDLQLPIDVLDNDTDPQGNIDPTTVQVVEPATHGTISVNPFSGLVIYTPEDNYHGTDSFTYEVCDTDGFCDTALVDITINPINDPLLVTDDLDITLENIDVTTDILTNDSDPLDPFGNIDPATLSIVTNPQNGLVSINPTTYEVTYTPETGFYGTDFYVYEVCDDGNPLPPTCNTATVTITVTQESPTVVDDFVNIIEDTQTDMDILQNDSDPQNNFDLSSISIITDPLHGVASVNFGTGMISYNPNPGYHGPDTLQYEICDMDGYCGQALVFITVDPVNDPPVVNDDIGETPENIPVTLNIITNDDDPDDLLGNIDPATISLISQPTNGSVTIDLGTGDITYTPSIGYYGIDSFDYEVCDDGYPLPPNCSQAIVEINIVHQSPTANNDFGSGDEEDEILVNILLNDTDPQNVIDPTTAEIIVQPPNGTAILNEVVGIVSYIPNENFNGLDSLVYQVCDPDGYCDEGTVYFTVYPLNDPPVIVDDNDATSENAAVTTNVLANDSDINDPLGNIDPLTLMVTVNPQNGSIDIDPANGNITYTPNTGFIGFDQYTYEVCDDGNPLPALCSSAIVTIQVIQEAPTAVNDTIISLEDTPVNIAILANDIDIQNNINPGSVSLIVPPTYGIATYDAGTQLVTYSPSEDYNGADSFMYEVCDSMELCDQATVTITIEAVNDAPIVMDDNESTAENMAVTTLILENDNDSHDPLGNIDPTSVSIITQPDHGQVDIDPSTGAITYVPINGYYGFDTYTYNVCDDGYPLPALCNSATVTLNIILQSPTAEDDELTTSEDTPSELNVLANDNDPQNNLDPGSVEIFSDPVNGSATVSIETGAVLYTPALNYYGQDSLVYTVCDLDGYCDQASIYINVLSVNDPPVANDDFEETGQNVALTTNVLLNDSDINDPLGNIDPSTVTIVTEPLHGSVNVDPTYGYILYQPEQGYLGNDSYTYKVADNGIPAPVLWGEGTVHISIQEVNQSPLAIADYGTAFQGGTTSLDVVLNDSDPDGNLDPSTLSILGTPTSGATVTTDGNGWVNIDYSNTLAFFGLDSISYQVCDSLGLCDSDIIYIEVTENLPPVANADYATTSPSGMITINVLGNDTDPENNINPASIEVIVGPASGAEVYIDDNWQLEVDYFNVPDFIDQDTLIYKICDQLNDCDTAKVIITVGNDLDDPVKVPQGFSPNGDGVNDYFVIPGIEDFPESEIYVYNRWGGKVYNAKGYDNSWDGKSNNNMAMGEPLAAGTYFYVLTLANGIEAMTGYVYINH